MTKKLLGVQSRGGAKLIREQLARADGWREQSKQRDNLFKSATLPLANQQTGGC